MKTDFQSLFPNLPANLRTHVPQFDYLLRDFSHRSELELRGDLWLFTTLSILRAILAPTLSRELPELVKLIFQIRAQRNGLDFAYMILYYLGKGTARVSESALRHQIDQHTSQGEEIMATIAHKYIQEGLEKGKKAQARSVAIKSLPLLNDEQISLITGLSLAEVQEIRQANSQSK